MLQEQLKKYNKQGIELCAYIYVCVVTVSGNKERSEVYL